jgi:hypothetical protein
MNPDLFITIVFSSFVFLVGIAGALFVTVTVRGRRRADASLNPPPDGADARSPQPVVAPSQVTLHSERPAAPRMWRP